MTDPGIPSDETILTPSEKIMKFLAEFPGFDRVDRDVVLTARQLEHFTSKVRDHVERFSAKNIPMGIYDPRHPLIGVTKDFGNLFHPTSDETPFQWMGTFIGEEIQRSKVVRLLHRDPHFSLYQPRIEIDYEYDERKGDWATPTARYIDCRLVVRGGGDFFQIDVSSDLPSSIADGASVFYQLRSLVDMTSRKLTVITAKRGNEMGLKYLEYIDSQDLLHPIQLPYPYCQTDEDFEALRSIFNPTDSN